MAAESKRAKTTVEWLVANPNLPDGLPKDIALSFQHWSAYLNEAIPDGAEKATALRKMLEAKDCAVRATLQFG